MSDAELLQEYQSKQLAQRAMAAGGSDNYLNDVTGRTSQDYSKMSDEELLRMAGLSKPPPVVTPQPKTGPMVSGDDLTRVAGRTGRTLASGAATLADIPGMLLKVGGDLGYDTGRKAVNVFFPDLASYMPPRRTETIPLPSEGVRRTIDQLSGNKFAPQNRLEKAVDTAGEFMAGLGGGSLLNKAAGLTTEAVRKAPASLDTIVNSMQARKTADLTAAAGAGIGQEYGGLPGAIAGAYIGGKVGSIPDSIENSMTRKPVPTADQKKLLAKAAYKQAEDLGGILSPKFTNKFADVIDDMAIQTEEGKIFSGGESLASKVAERMKLMRDKPISLRGAQEMDEYMSDLIDAQTDFKGMSKQGQKIYDMQTKFRELIESAGEGDIVGGKEGFQALEKGRELWSKQLKMRDIERIQEKALLTRNPAQSMRTAFGTLIKSKRFNSYNAEEKAAIRAASKAGLVGGAVEMAGSRILGVIAGTAAGGLGGGGVGALGGAAAAAAAGMPIRKLGTTLQINRANEVARLIAGQNSPARQPSNYSLLTADMAKQLRAAPQDVRRGLVNVLRDQSGGGWSP